MSKRGVRLTAKDYRVSFMNRTSGGKMKFFIHILLVGAIALFAVSDASAKRKKPNLILILTDDQGYADVGFNGSTEIKTPNIDRIAYEGARFDSGYVSFPVCGPSRAGLLTGRYQDRFGFILNPSINPADKAGLPKSEKNIAEVLKPAGYRTAILGKWHMGTHPVFHPNRRGFDYFWGFLSGGHRYFPHELTLNSLDEVERAWQWYSTRILRNNKRIDIDEYLTDEISNEAVAFIKREKKKPFFLYVAYNAPHAPLQATEKYLKRFSHVENKRRRTYLAMVSAVDDGVGRILDTLEEEGLDEDTIVVFLSDNGGALKKNASDNGILRDGKGSPFEGGIRVPFAMRWKGVIPAGLDYKPAVISLDILATIVGEAKVSMRRNKKLDGVNLIPYLTGKKRGEPHDILFWRGWNRKYTVARAGGDKIITAKKTPMLYNLEEDISEKNNLYRKNKKRYESLNAKVEEWKEDFSPPIFTGLGEWTGNNNNKKNNKKKKRR